MSTVSMHLPPLPTNVPLSSRTRETPFQRTFLSVPIARPLLAHLILFFLRLSPLCVLF